MADDNSVSDSERVVLEKLLTYTVSLRDVAARFDQDEQWTRYSNASTVINEVLADGWDDPTSSDVPEPAAPDG